MSVKSAANGKTESTGKFANRIERYGWKAQSEKGRIEWLDKNSLNVDHEYQRDNVSQSKVLEIARDWDWRACGTISVAKRADGSYWVFDGQHRTLGARKRDDISTLPCWVFDVGDKREEAAGYIAANTVRGPVRSLEKFKARLVAQDSVALDVAALVESVGYIVAGGPAKFHLGCVQAVESELVKDRETAETVLSLCADIYCGEPIQNQAFKGLCYIHSLLKKSGDKITRPDIRTKLMKSGPDEITRAINSAIGYRGRGGEKVYADGIVNLVNKGKRTNLLPTIIK